MLDPKPINLKTDDAFRREGWGAVSRDKDGHATSCYDTQYDETLAEWLLECFRAGYTVTNLDHSQAGESPATSQQEGT